MAAKEQVIAWYIMILQGDQKPAGQAGSVKAVSRPWIDANVPK